MRLQVIEQPRGLIQKLRFFLLRSRMGRIPCPILAMSYQRELCGKYLAHCYQEGLRQAREWSVGEIEIFAAFCLQPEPMPLLNCQPHRGRGVCTGRRGASARSTGRLADRPNQPSASRGIAVS